MSTLRPSDDLIMAVLRRYVSEPTARGMLRRAAGLSKPDGSREDPGRFMQELAQGGRIFLETADSKRLEHDLQALEQGSATDQTARVDIRDEHDARRARMLARNLSLDVGMTPLYSLRAATAVSELSRNIVLYAGSGSIALAAQPGPPPRMQIIAEDQGPGIQNLEQILSGKYKSKTGLGRGLSGTRQIAHEFDVKTGPQGTSITVELISP